MFEGTLWTICSLFAVIILPVLFVVNYYYQLKNKKFIDDMLLQIPTEYNKQIKGNAIRILINRTIWGLIVLSGFIFNFQVIIAQGLSWINIFVIAFGLGLIVWGLFGFKSEIKKIKSLK